MSIEINELAELCAWKSESKTSVADFGFQQAVDVAINSRNSFVAVSPKFEKQMREDPDLAREIAEKIEKMLAESKNCKDSMIIVDRRGEITEYHNKPYNKEEAEREAEIAKEVEKSRLRRKARLDAYFKLVERVAVRRKLIEQENAKRPRGKRYRSDPTKLDMLVKSISQEPNDLLPCYF